MKMQRYHARDMRQALARIRAEQGPDAVILSTQRTATGVVVCAAIDFDFGEPPAAQALGADPAAVQPLPRVDPDLVAGVEDRAADEYAPAATPPAAADDAVREELRGLRRLLESQVAALAWNDYSRREPLRARVLEELSNLGLARELALELVGAMPRELDAEQAARAPLAQLARRIATLASPALERGGVLALVGPNGAGKTTTLAKLATRWVLERGARELALVTTDRDRFGAQEQLQALGRVLGVPALVAEPGSLATTLARLRDRRLVLVDTPGTSARSERLEPELGALATAHPGLELALVLPASAQAGTLEESVARFGALLNPAHCVLTRLDEATSLGGAISALVRAQLPVSWLGTGPRVPDDLEPARAHALVARAARLARGTGAHADEDLLARRFGGLLNAAA